MMRRAFLWSPARLTELAALPAPAAAGARPRGLLLQTSPVAEFQYHNGKAMWGGLRVGQALTLVREPRNPYDEKAVRVDWNGYQLGYVPRTENDMIAQLLDRGEKLSARIVELNDENSNSWEWEWERVRFEIVLEKIVSPAGRHTGNGKHTL